MQQASIMRALFSTIDIAALLLLHLFSTHIIFIDIFISGSRREVFSAHREAPTPSSVMPAIASRALIISTLQHATTISAAFFFHNSTSLL